MGEVLERLDRDSQYLMAQPRGGASLDIATIPTSAMRWLISRLSRLQRKYPDITVHLAERTEPFVLAGGGFDAAIHFEHAAWTGMRTHRLLDEVLVPACRPKLVKGSHGMATLDSLPRLHRRHDPDAWQRHSQETGIPPGNPAIGARYDLHSILIQVALARLGVALVPRLYVETELASGRLVVPWPEGATMAKTFCLILPEPIGVSSEPI